MIGNAYYTNWIKSLILVSNSVIVQQFCKHLELFELTKRWLLHTQNRPTQHGLFDSRENSAMSVPDPTILDCLSTGRLKHCFELVLVLFNNPSSPASFPNSCIKFNNFIYNLSKCLLTPQLLFKTFSWKIINLSSQELPLKCFFFWKFYLIET